MSNKSNFSNDNNKKSSDTIPCRIEFIKDLLKNKNISSLVNFDNTDTECFIGGGSRDEEGSGESNDTRVVLQKRVCDFTQTIMQLGGNGEQLDYIKSGTTGHTFKGTVKDDYGTFEYGVKVVAYPKKERYGDMYDVRRPENAELKMIKALSYFVVKSQTPHIVLPIGTFDTDIKIFTTDDFKSFVGEDNEKYQEFLTKYKNGDYHDKVSVLLSEWANRGDLLEFLRSYYNKPQFTASHWKSIFFQLFSVLAVIHTKYPAFRHNDLKANNVLIHKIKKQDDYFTYRIARKKYKVKNIGYQIKLWDFDFACIPDIVDNKKVGLEWTKMINVIPKQNKYYDIHYFFNTLIKRGFVPGIMTSNKVPQEVKDFINRILPKKYQNDPKAYELKKLINDKLAEKYNAQYKKYRDLYKKEKNKEYYNLAKKYSDMYSKCDDNDYGGKYIHNYFIPQEIKENIKEILDERPEYNNVLLGYVHEKGRLLIDDEYLTPQKILEEDPYFEEFRKFDDNDDNKKKKNINKEPNDASKFLQKAKTTMNPNLANFLTNDNSKNNAQNNNTQNNNARKYLDANELLMNNKKVVKKNVKKNKSRTISDDIKRVNINDIFAD